MTCVDEERKEMKKRGIPLLLTIVLTLGLTAPAGAADTAGVTMLVRLMCKEQNAKWSTAEIPFTNVPNWGLPYVRYSYGNGYTKGTSGTTFGSTAVLDAAQYLTLLLQAMGYEDGTDFQWDSLWTLSNQPGFTDYDPAHPGAFTRGTAAV